MISVICTMGLFSEPLRHEFIGRLPRKSVRVAAHDAVEPRVSSTDVREVSPRYVVAVRASSLLRPIRPLPCGPRCLSADIPASITTRTAYGHGLEPHGGAVALATR